MAIGNNGNVTTAEPGKAQLVPGFRPDEECFLLAERFFRRLLRPSRKIGFPASSICRSRR